MVLAVSASFAGCSFDLSISEAPSRGRIVGSIDTGKHVPLEGQRVDLAGADGAQLSQTTIGAFVFADVPPGIYTVGLATPAFAKFSSSIVRVRDGQDTDLGVLTPDWLQNTPQEATLTGLVTSTIGGDVTGTKVEFMLGRTPIAQVTVSADGVRHPSPAGHVLAARHRSLASTQMRRHRRQRASSWSTSGQWSMTLRQGFARCWRASR